MSHDASRVLVAALAAVGIACSTPTAPTLSPGNAPMPSLSTFQVTSTAGRDGGVLPVEHTCDGAGVSPELSWSGAPAGTREFAVLMTTLPGDGTTKWNWVLYGIPAATTGLSRASTGIGTQGYGSDGPSPGYQPPCSQGPGAKVYTFTVAALSAPPVLPTGRVTGLMLTDAIRPLTLASASISLHYTRPTAAIQEFR